MRVIFVCDVVPLGSGPRGAVGPAIELVRNAATGTFPCSWTISANPPIAAGVADVNADQLAALQADSRIIVVDLAHIALRLTQLPAAWRNAIKNKLTALGVSSLDSDSVQTVFERAAARANGIPIATDFLHGRLKREWGLA